VSVQFMPSKESKAQRFTIPLTLTPKQMEIDGTDARFKIIRAGRKFGKSTYAEYSCLKHCSTPGAVVLFIAPTYHQGKMIAWEDFKKLIPREALAKKPNETDLVLTIKNGAKIYVMGADTPDSLRGLSVDHAVLEEAAMHKSEVWDEVVRPNLTARCGTADFITTPKGFNWFKDLEDNARAQISKYGVDSDWAVFHYSIFDNPHIKREEIESARKDCDSEAVWNQEYLALYESSVGRVFSQFSDERHCHPIQMPSGITEVYRAVDYGMRDDTACLWGRLSANKLLVYREHLQKDTAASVQAQLIQNKTTPSENVAWNIISHDAAKEDPEMKGLTVAWHFRNAGMTPMRTSSRDKKSSRHMIQRLINEDRLVVDPVQCPKLRKQLLAYEWQDTLMEKTVDGKDDAVDALHYLVEGLSPMLFMDHADNKPKDFAEMIRLSNEELRKKHRYKVDMDEKEMAFTYVDSPAGYL
jgi:hypothetical protein